jgi:hypothetical protein
LDFRTTFGAAIDTQSGLQGYPAGQINRRNFPGYEQTDASGNPVSGILAQGRGTWVTTAPTVMGESSYINVALEAEVDAATRIMTVDVEMFETGTAASSYNLNVALLQSGIEGTQTGSSLNPDQVLPNGNYVHNHVLRHLLTGQWGEVITSGAGVVTRQYTYTLPANIAGVPLVLGDISIAAFIAEGQTNIVTGDEGEITYTNLSSNDAAVENVVAPAEICGNTVDADFTLINNGGNAMTAATIEYGFAGQTPTTMNWTGNLSTFASEDIQLSGVTVPSGGGTLNVTVTAVNGGADSNNGNNATTTSVAITTNAGTGTDYTVNFTQDRYGSESTWTVKDENGTTLASGGPYSDLTANGVQAHTATFTASATGCFEMVVNDTYGDGINDGYGAGFYNIKNTTSGMTVLSSNGQFGSMEEKPFEITSLTVGVDENVISAFNIYPNPVNDLATIKFDVTNMENLSMVMTNSLGAIVKNDFNVSNGSNVLTVDCTDLTSGLYFVTFSSNGQNTVKKFNVIK